MKIVNDYIEKQKEVEPSPFLESRILARLENTTSRKSSVFIWQGVAAVVSVVVVIMLGIVIGNEYKPVTYLPVNDYQIENFSIITADDYQ